MKERPILFSSPMVRAILNGTKTQTRRPMKPQPELLPTVGGDPGFWYPGGVHPKTKLTYKNCLHYGSESHFRKGVAKDFSPYGQPGDRLWVRETWAINHLQMGWEKAPKHDPSWRASDTLIYRADGEWSDQFEQIEGDVPPWRPSIHMPRWASRILLEVTDVRVERLQEISKEDAIAEGMIEGEAGWGAEKTQADSRDHCLGTVRMAFANLINKIHGGPHWNLDSKPTPLWDQNPFVWVISFRRRHE